VPAREPEEHVVERRPAPRGVAVTAPARVDPPVRVETPAPVTVAASAPSTPVRVATIETPKPTPAVTVSPKPARRPTWVSRPASEEREIYASERDETRLADARDDLQRDANTNRKNEVSGFVTP